MKIVDMYAKPVALPIVCSLLVISMTLSRAVHDWQKIYSACLNIRKMNTSSLKTTVMNLRWHEVAVTGTAAIPYTHSEIMADMFKQFLQFTLY